MRRCGRRSRRLLLLAAWAPMQSRMVDRAVLASPEGRALPAFEMQRESILSEAREIADGEREQGFNPRILDARAPNPRRREPAIALIGGAVAICVALLAAGLALRRSAPQFRARTGVERWVMVVLFAASLIAILTTLGILLSLMFESLRFFRLYPLQSISCSALEWSPQTAIRADQAGSSGAFGSIPLVLGHHLHRRDHRDDRRRPAGPDERDLPDPICAPARARRG